MLASDFVLGIGNRWANRHTGGLDVYRAGRTFVHVDIEPTQIGRVFAPDYGIVSDAKAALEQLVAVATRPPGRRAAGRPVGVGRGLRGAQAHDAAADALRQRADQAAAGLRGDEPAFGRDVRYVSTIGLSQIAGAQFLHVYEPRHWINCGQAGPLGWTVPATLGVCVADPDATVVALSGDYDFQFMIEELAVGAQFNLPYIHVVVNNSYLGLIRQSPARLRHGLLRPAGVRQRQLPRARAATASTTSRSPRAWAARRSGSPSRTSCPRRSSRRSS